MKRPIHFPIQILALCVAALLAGHTTPAALAQAAESLPCADPDTKCARQAALQSPVRKKSFWSAAMSQPLEQRIGVAPAELLTYLALDNMADGITNRPRAPRLAADLRADILAALAELPPDIKRAVDRKLAGILLVSDLGGTGYTDYAKGGWFGRDAGFVVLDVDVLAGQTANAWATWKENTPFMPDPAFRLEAIIEEPAADNRKNAIQYILLHELGHILSIGETVHPNWDREPNADLNLDRYAFADLSWRIVPEKNRYASRFDKVFVQRTDVVYYFGAKLAASTMRPVYEQLENTNFPTLYAATRPGDDFAESFASYVHTVIMRRPWQIRIHEQGTLVRTFGTCWLEQRCAPKRRLLEDFLGIGTN
jgi:hypothetical protein